jgi:alkylation response protein AidB-like acyl-CoA dehydrogenase
MTTATDTPAGGAWLTSDTAAGNVQTPEGLTDEHRLIGRTAAEFIAGDVLPALDDLDRKDWDRARTLLRRAGDLGLVGVDVPESLGGVALDTVTSVVVSDAVGACASFATTFGAQTGLTIIPLLCFGTEAQQRAYLPRIVTGELVGAYCLSESGSGSDALSARARADRQPDGSWLLNGEKLWITNGGFADLFVVFAKVDGEQFSAFLVERGFPGVTAGNEEHKMGLQGSSTTPVVLSDARVPAGNLLGETGRGHKIAFNVLNYGRLKLAAMCTGNARRIVREAATYAMSRRQFDRPIGTFGAIRHKLAEMTVQLFAVEAGLFRAAGLIDARLGPGGHDGVALAATLEEYAIEAALLKVAGSEMLAFVADENVQIHGGNGFVRDYPAERHYRDQRVNRIFEGTNEINRLLVPAMVVKRALKGTLPVIASAKALRASLLAPTPARVFESAAPIDAARRTVGGIKRTAIMLIGLALETYGQAMADEQEVVMLASDVIREAYLAESAVLRAERAVATGHALASAATDAATIVAHDAGYRAEASARVAIAAMVWGDAQRVASSALRRVLKVAPVNTIAARRRLADAVTERKRYPFGFC